jgi:catechol 2,3-dioxygenase-like lactoylglutathione lyase family enzyme
MSQFKIMNIHHAAFATSNIEKTIRYWRDLLGFKLVVGLKMGEGKQYFFATDEKIVMSFFEWKDVEPVAYRKHGEPVTGPFIFDHIALRMDSYESLYHLQDQLIEAELPVSDIVDHGFIHSIYTYDPNRIPLEFTVLVKNLDLTNTFILRDDEPAAVVLEGAHPVAGHWPDPEPYDGERIVVIGEGSELFEK